MADVPFSTHLAVKATSLPRSYFKFPPSSTPATLPPPANYATFAHPFTIPPNVYNALLEPSVPITIAIIYVTIVTYLNTINIKHKKPWPVSQAFYFRPLVILHNAILALYSAWTFVGMINALVLSVPGFRGEYGLAGVADSLCKINGPRGIGSAAFYNETSSAWTITNKVFHLAADGLTPEPTDVGRIWNEGLAFYGWLFYLSKFYEVIDTFIILAKGKKSSFLQTYHHAGAMLCMWAGIRYMSPPIWMFVLVNSGIHAIMYTFYLCTALGIKINKRVKQSLTTLQITQFVVGTVYAFSHLFVAYQVPVSVPYLHHLGRAVSSVVSAVPSEASSAKSAAFASASAGAGAWLKKAALRAAGREGLAENVLNDRGQTFGVDTARIMEEILSTEEPSFRDELRWTHCLDTSGQVFAILLNCLYLAPLTGLFVRFFIKAYLRQMERRRSSVGDIGIKSFRDATKGFSRQVGEMHGSDGKEPRASEFQPQVDKAVEKLESVAEKVKESLDKEKLNEEFSNGMKQLKQSLEEKHAEKVQETASQLQTDENQSTVFQEEPAIHESISSSKTENTTGADIGTTSPEAETGAVQKNEDDNESIQPHNTADAPEEINASPEEAVKSAPKSTEVPEEATHAPENQAEASQETTEIPEEKSADPEGTTEIPKDKSADPEGAAEVSEDKTEIPEDETDIPGGKTEVREETTETPEAKTEENPIKPLELETESESKSKSDTVLEDGALEGEVPSHEPQGNEAPEDGAPQEPATERTLAKSEPLDEQSSEGKASAENAGMDQSDSAAEPKAEESASDKHPEADANEREIEPQSSGAEEKVQTVTDSPNESGTGADEDSGSAKGRDDDVKVESSTQDEEQETVPGAAEIENEKEAVGANIEGKANGEIKDESEEPTLETSKSASIKSSTPKPPPLHSAGKEGDVSGVDQDPTAIGESNSEELHKLDDNDQESASSQVKEGTSFADAVKA